LIKPLEEAGVEVEVMTPFPMLERFAFRSFSGFLRLVRDTPISIYRIRRIIRAYRPDCIHTNLSILFTPAVAARLTRTPHVWHIRETYVEFGFLWKLFRRIMLWGADRIVAISNSVAEQFNGMGMNKIVVLHNGYPKEEYGAVPETRITSFKDKYGLDNARVVGLVGRIKFVRKGQEILVQAAALLKPRFPSVKFLLIGSPFPGNEDHLERLRSLIVSLGVEDNVIYTGDVEDVAAAYAVQDIAVMASCLPEPLGGVTIESMAFGKPVVGTNVGGTPEIIEDGVTGILVPVSDPQAMADAIACLLDDPALGERMGTAGRARYELSFEYERFFEKMMNVYRELCG
jgi:glycosyltransferase involved in cell wall biosynthesis